MDNRTIGLVGFGDLSVFTVGCGSCRVLHRSSLQRNELFGRVTERQLSRLPSIENSWSHRRYLTASVLVLW